MRPGLLIQASLHSRSETRLSKAEAKKLIFKFVKPLTKLTEGYLITKDPQPLCSQRQTIPTLKHIIEGCPQYEQLL